MSETIQGIVIRGVAGFFEVINDQGEVFQVGARGKLRRDGGELLVGDRVVCSYEGEQLMISQVFPRRNRLLRPPVANISQVVLVFSCSLPEPNWLLLDRLLLMAEQQEIRPIIFLNKTDLVPSALTQQYIAVYEHTDYLTITGSTNTGEGIGELRQALQEAISVLAGPSGVGKSSLLNHLNPSWKLEVGDVSARLRRGKHTTRQVQLLVLARGSMVADTPGFYSLESAATPSRSLASYYPEMRPVLGDCYFGSSCLHYKENDCAVKDLLATGALPQQRYNNYLILLEEMLQKEGRNR
ncbi:MAG: ribosome small subunit-dependent GTPase A [Symbiobacteriaceae bacterium]|nr:ribosome small subunit-dependent GTPase A [Symbiobacteriaceae bacterium]